MRHHVDGERPWLLLLSIDVAIDARFRFLLFI